MNNIKIKNSKTGFNRKIEIIRNDLYNTKEISKYERSYMRKHAIPSRKQRNDLNCGNLVVILEGRYTGKRGIFLKQSSDYKAAIFVLQKLNEPVIFKIDERFLLKLNTSIDFSNYNFQIDFDKLIETKIYEEESINFNVENDKSLNEINKIIMETISTIKFMKSYLISDFKVDDNVEFYSQKY